MSEEAAPVAAPSAVAASTPARALDRLANLGWGLLGAAPLATAAILTPSASGYGTHQQLGLPPCTFLWLTGVPCPFCGMTTSWTHAAHGHLLASLRTQPFGLVLFAADAALVLWLFSRVAVGGAAFRPERLLSAIPGAIWWGALLATMAAWVYKIVVVLAA